MILEKLRIAWYSRKLKRIPPSYDFNLQKYNEYYRNLNPDLQRIFRERVYISSKFIDFQPVKFRNVTDEMKILITSALIQITFGLDKYILKRFNTILVVPNTYSFGQYEALLGHVDNDQDLITMSWPAVKEGFIIPDDAFNVALHELAHALQKENVDPFLYTRFFDALVMKEWKDEASIKLYEIRAKRHNFLRDYAGNNLGELFAVSFESFFEQPDEFAEKVPRLYAIMTELLNQNPINKSNPL